MEIIITPCNYCGNGYIHYYEDRETSIQVYICPRCKRVIQLLPPRSDKVWIEVPTHE